MPGGQLFIYTRTPQQNARTIWGRYFPGFSEHEQRLHSDAAFRDAVRRTDGLTVVATQTFNHPRLSTAGRLRAQAEGRHYSTFSLYTPEELRASIATFLARLPGPEVSWVDEHLLVVAGASLRNQAEPYGPGSMASQAGYDQAPQISAMRAGKAPGSRPAGRPATRSLQAASATGAPASPPAQARLAPEHHYAGPGSGVRVNGLAIGAPVRTAAGRPPRASPATRWPPAADCDGLQRPSIREYARALKAAWGARRPGPVRACRDGPGYQEPGLGSGAGQVYSFKRRPSWALP